MEFCAHIVYAFLGASGSRAARSSAALRRVGASVLSGITLTKLVGAPHLPSPPHALSPCCGSGDHLVNL